MPFIFLFCLPETNYYYSLDFDLELDFFYTMLVCNLCIVKFLLKWV